MTVHTLGHGTLTAEAFAALVIGAKVSWVVDVRSYPGSRRNPQFGREEMQRWLPQAGLAYSWMGELGGRRRSVSNSEHIALRDPAFRGYADHMGTSHFLVRLEELVTVAAGEPTAVMCSESLWWRCHRRLLADHLVLVRDVEVVHMMHDGRLTPHVVTDGVRLAGGHLIYDVGATPPLPGA